MKNPLSIDLKSYFQADFSAQPTNLAQDTRIAERVESNGNSNDSKDSPSLAEGARGWVKFTLSSLQGDSHESRKAIPFICHTERNEVKRSIHESNETFGFFATLRMTIDCHDSVFAESRNDKIAIKLNF